MEYKDICKGFEKLYKKEPEVLCFAPGRVNLIGEHTDYNGGHVFPCAINLGIYCAAAKRSDRKLRLYSSDFSKSGISEYDIDDMKPVGYWTDYPAGVIKAFAAFGYKLESGADLFFSGDIPCGAGLSSSAALESAVCIVLKELFFIPVTKQESALIGQFAENRFVGVNCGIMDQFASLMGRKDSALLIDTNTLDYRYYPLGDVSLVIVNSGVKHSLASSAYNQRRKECESASGELGVSALCSLSPEKFEIKKNMIKDDVCRRRAKHAVYENSRTLEAASALENGDIKEFGRLMKMSHISLRDDYEVSCKELDFLAESAWQIKGVYGARMTGGGFGGCTVNLVRQSVSEEFISVISSEYEEHFGIIPEIYKVKASDGAGVIIS